MNKDVTNKLLLPNEKPKNCRCGRPGLPFYCNLPMCQQMIDVLTKGCNCQKHKLNQPIGCQSDHALTLYNRGCDCEDKPYKIDLNVSEN